MAAPREERLAGLDCVNAVTALLQRVRNAHPTKGAFQAAEVQYWWNTPHPTDTLGQLFWFDDFGRPESAVVAAVRHESPPRQDWTGLGYNKDPVHILTEDGQIDCVPHGIR